MIESVLRRLGVADLERLVALERTRPRPWGRDQLETLLTDEAVCVLGVEAEGQLAGHAVVARLPFEAELQAMLVAPPMRRRGLAASLLTAVIDQALRWESERLLLEVRESNAGAIALYRQAGFDEDGRRRGYYPALSLPGLESPDHDAIAQPPAGGRAVMPSGSGPEGTSGAGAGREDAILMSRRLL
ncbi:MULTISPECIES: GNAT family N-acetyltransferase [Halomonas]|uniref:Ribosomal-protein-alanine N-acetyltransferase n=1 Tax=Halomonas chromatireducens TaxID=507626 RepID=A0A120JWJ5_9GAMM|nr:MULTISPECIES: GNAT family N-acetyltransferase [Halomonas]AMD02066.1 ribosomal-protein-alanine N-acetyltransferase [Halomonas chromatireducens]MBZ0330228.1 GNAT family N-acetyltransferase [Halomonas sp. ANAO-440]